MKKLKLCRETLRELSTQQLGAVAGGAKTLVNCPTAYCNPTLVSCAATCNQANC